MIRHNANKFVIGAGMVVGVAAAVLLAAQLPAEAQVPGQDGPAAQESRAQSSIKVGTYDEEAAFQAHPAQEELMGALRTAQTQMEKARKEQDQQKMQEVQQQYAQARQQAMQQFEQDLSKALPETARKAGVKVVATQVAYKAEDVKTVDITPLLVEAFTNQEGQDDTGKGNPPGVPQFSR